MASSFGHHSGLVCLYSFDLSPVSIVVASAVAEDGHQQGRESESRQRDDEAYGAHHCTGNEMMSVRSSNDQLVDLQRARHTIFTEQRSFLSGSTVNHQQMRTPGAIATAYLPLLSCTVGTRDALI
jgi:hypothetical protein